MSSITYVRDAKNFVIAMVVKTFDGEIVYPVRFHPREKLMQVASLGRSRRVR